MDLISEEGIIMKKSNYLLLLFCTIPFIFLISKKNISIATDSYQILHYSTLKNSIDSIKNKEFDNVIIGSCLGGYQLLDNILFEEKSINLSSDSQSPFSSFFHLNKILKNRKIKNVIYQLDYDDLSSKYLSFNARESLFDLSNIHPHNKEILVESIRTGNLKVIIQDLLYYLVEPNDVRKAAQDQKLDYYPTRDYESDEYLHLYPSDLAINEIEKVLALLKEHRVNTIILSQPLPSKIRVLLEKNNSSDLALEKIASKHGATFLNLNNIREFQYDDSFFENNRLKPSTISKYNMQLKLFLKNRFAPF